MRFQFGGAEIIDRRYVMQQQLGKGGMGAVYEAFDRLTQEAVALKLVTKPPTELDFASRSDGLNLYLALAQEFKVLASLRHPNIISVLNYGFDDQQRPYFTMDLLKDAQSPSRAVWGKGDTDKVNLIIQILQALSYLHRRGIIHRDLKPANVRVVGNEVKVLDFGLATLYKEEHIDTERIVGTIEYMAPELLRQQQPSVQSDLYALGVMSYELFTGKYLYDNPNVRELARQIFYEMPDFSVIRNDPVAAVLTKMMAKDANERYASADEVIIALAQATHQPIPAETAAIRESFLQAATFVGRQRELDDLSQMMQEASKGLGGAVLVAGESGVGKSRLLDELRIRAMVQGVQVLRGEGASTGRNPYHIWRNVIRMLILSADISEQEAGILQTLVPDISRLLNIKPATPEELEPLAAQERLTQLIEKLFRQQEQPLLVILEDAHWAGTESLAVLYSLLRILPQLPVMIVVSYRDDESPEMPTMFPDLPLLKLQRLGNAAIEELAAAMLGDRGRSERLVKFLQQETEGNVFFVVEIMRALAQEVGNLDGVSTMQLPTHVFTGGVDQVVQRRLRRVPEEIRPMLQVAASIGRYLDENLLKVILQEDERLERWLTICNNVAVLESEDGQWRFSHEKLREGVVRDIPADIKPDISFEIARAIENIYLPTSTGRDYHSQLAYHWAVAGNPEKEGHYAALYGSQVLDSGSYREAATYLERALELMPQATDTEMSKKKASLTSQIGDAYLGLGNYKHAKQIYETSLQLRRDAGYKWGIAETLSDLGHVSYNMQAYEDSYHYFRESIETAMSVKAQKVAVDGIVGVARLMTAAQKYDWAIELVAFALDFADVASVETKTVKQAEQLKETLRQKVSPEVFEESVARGRDKRLSDIVAELLQG